MRAPSKTLIWKVAAIVAVAGVSAGVFLWRGHVRDTLAATFVPATPDLKEWPTAMPTRVHAMEERIFRGDGAVAALGELSRLYHANGFFGEASRCYEGLAELDGAEPRWLHRHAVILAGYGDVERAAPLWRRVVKLDPGYLPAGIRLAEILAKDNQFEEAKRLFEEVLKREPREAYAQLGLARLAFEREDWEAARVRLESVVALTNYQLGYDLIVTVYERLGQAKRAATLRGKQFASGAYRDPTDPWIDELYDDCYDLYRLSLAGGAAARTGDNGTAVRRLEQALALSPDNVPIRFQLAGIYTGMRAHAKALAQLKRCTELEPEFSDGWAQLSSVLTTMGDNAGAARALAQGIVHCPESFGLHLMRARQARDGGRIDAAIEDFRTASRLRPNDASPLIDLAAVLLGLNRVEEGVDLLQQALVAEPGNPVALTAIALHAIMDGDEPTAREWLSQVDRQPRVPAADRERLALAFGNRFGKPLP